MKARFNPIFVSLIVIGMAAPIAKAGIIWDGGGADTNINTAANWDGDVVNALDGTTAATFGTGGATATINTNASFTGITINRDGNFEIANGAGSLTLGSGGVSVTLPTTTARTHTISESSLILGASQVWSLANNTGTARLNVSGVIDDGSSTFGLTKAGSGLLVLSGNNTFNGNVAFTDNSSGQIRATHSGAFGAGTKTVAATFGSGIRIELDGSAGNLNFASGIAFSVSGSSLRNSAGDNIINGTTGAALGAGTGIVEVTGGTLTLAGTVRAVNSGNRTLDIRGSSNGFITGQIIDGSSILSLTKNGTGTWRITNSSNNHTGATLVNQGTLVVTRASGLGVGTNVAGTNPTGGNVSVSSGATLNYQAAADSPLAIGGSLAVIGGTTTAIGGSIGSTLTSASINVAGAASVTDAAHAVNLYKVPGTSAITGTYNLITGGAGSTLKPATAPTLGKVYNNSDFTVGSISRTDTTLDVAITAVAPLATAYWTGGLADSTNVWAVSGTAASNWVATAGGTAQVLVPGSGTDVIISATTINQSPATTVLGADMTIKSLTISDTTNGLGLNADGYTLTLASGGITMDSAALASTIAAKVALGALQTWTNNSINNLTVSGTVSGANALTKAGSGTLVLSSANTYTGDTRIAAGTLVLANLNAIATSTLDMNTADAGSVSFTVAGTNTYNIGGLAGTRAINAAGNTLSVGAKNVATEYSGELSNGALTKVGTNTLTLSGTNTFAGNVVVNAGRLTLASSGALGTGPKGLNMQGTNRTIYLKGDITIPANITMNLSSNSGDGSGLNNESGDNSILGPINITTGNPILNISSAAGSLSIAGNVTLTTTGRPLLLGGASTGNNTISGVIGSSSAEILPVTKQGAGKWIFTNTNTYTGDTTISDGTLLINGSTAAASAVAVNGASVLGGTGTVNGPVTVAATATLAPGVALGTLNLGTTTLDGTLACDVDGANTDVLAITGDLNLGGTAVLSVNIINPATSGTHVIATYTGSRNGTLGGTLPVGYSLNYNDAGKTIELVAPSTSTPFQSWMSTNFPSVTPNTPEADPDNDGVSNLAEFALAGNPGNGTDTGLKRSAIDNIGGTDYMTYTFACRTGASFSLTSPALASKDGVDYAVRASTDLSAFTFGVDEVSPAITTGLPAVPTGYTYRTFRVTSPKNSQPKAFMQLKTSPTP